MTGLEIGLVTVAAWLLASFDLDDYNPALGAPNKRTGTLVWTINPGYVL